MLRHEGLSVAFFGFLLTDVNPHQLAAYTFQMRIELQSLFKGFRRVAFRFSRPFGAAGRGARGDWLSEGSTSSAALA